MRKYIKKKIKFLLESMREAHRFIANRIGKFNHEKLREVLGACQESAFKIGELIEREEKDSPIVIWLEEYCEKVYQLSLNENASSASVIKDLNKKLSQVENYIVHNLPDNLEIVFLPYKASMWTAMESIWIEAVKDKACNAVVVPIPYYEITKSGNMELNYEGDMYPSEVPVVSYKTYQLEERHPDMIFIHNPYDECNRLTRVPQKYYSSNLKQYTDLLVYCPYFTIGSYRKQKSDFMYVMPGIYNADIVLAQSEAVKKYFISYGHAEKKILAFGSPKVDAIVNCNHDSFEMPENWKKKLRDKPVFLLNTHLSYFPKCFQNEKKYNYAKKYFGQIIEAYFNRPDCGLIWRPHPLMRAFLRANCPKSLEFMNEIEERINSSSNCVIDKTGDYRVAFSYSSAMISTWSSLVNEYMLTGKPVLIFQKRQPEPQAGCFILDRNMNYFSVGEDKISFENFRDMVLRNEDPMYNSRMEMLKKAFANLDGNAGQKIYHYLCQQ